MAETWFANYAARFWFITCRILASEILERFLYLLIIMG